MHLLLILLLIANQQQKAPFKAAEEFKLELEYKFKNRPTADNSFIDLTETVEERQKRISGNNTPLPYLTIHISFQQLSEKEVRVRCADNNQKNRLSKKVELNKVYTIELGFTEDMKDRVTAYEYTFYLMDDDRNEISRVVMVVEMDGTFLVNGERRGKF